MSWAENPPNQVGLEYIWNAQIQVHFEDSTLLSNVNVIIKINNAILCHVMPFYCPHACMHACMHARMNQNQHLSDYLLDTNQKKMLLSHMGPFSFIRKLHKQDHWPNGPSFVFLTLSLFSFILYHPQITDTIRRRERTIPYRLSFTWPSRPPPSSPPNRHWMETPWKRDPGRFQSRDGQSRKRRLHEPRRKPCGHRVLQP